MKLNDFRYMRQGQQLHDVHPRERALLNPVQHYGEGHERALLVLHGFSSSPAVYRYLLPKIKHYDAIVCPVFPGHAESIAAFSQSTASDWLTKAREICCSLSQKYQKVDVLGLSLGGLIACELSALFPLNHLYLLAPALKLQMNVKFMLHIARFLHYLGFVHLRNAAGNLLHAEHAEITYRKLPINIIIELLNLVQNHQWQVPNCPIDLFLGAHDLVVDSTAVEQLFAPLSTTKIHWLHHSAHVLPLDNDLNEIIQCINHNSVDTAKFKA